MVHKAELENSVLQILQKHFNKSDSPHPHSYKFCTFEFLRAILAEFLATCLFVILLCSTALNWSNEPLNIVKISFTAGLTIATLVQCFGHISGGHVNPAVTAAFMVTRKLNFFRGMMYMVAQFVGAMAGAGILYGLTTTEIHSSLGINQVNPMISCWQGLGIEFILTFCLVFTIFATVDPHRKELGSSSLAIGFAVLIAHFVGIPFTGTGINPARSFGPAVIINSWEYHWVYWAGPFLGGPIAGLVYEYIFDRKHEVRELKDALKDTHQICLIPNMILGTGQNYRQEELSNMQNLPQAAPIYKV